MPLNILDSVASARSCFVRSVFDLPRSTSHELAVILFAAKPVEVLMLRRLMAFINGAKKHDFVFVRDALEIDCVSLASTPTSLFANLVRLVKQFEPRFSAMDDNVFVAAERILSKSNSATFSFSYIKFCESPTLSFFTLFKDVSVLESFRDFLNQRPYASIRFIVLFCASLLRFRLCARPSELCPLCGHPWLWEHFFKCRFLDLAMFFALCVCILNLATGRFFFIMYVSTSTSGLI